MGRPKVDPWLRGRHVQVTVMVTLPEKEAIFVAAAEAGMSVGGYIRALVWPDGDEEPDNVAAPDQ